MPFSIIRDDITRLETDCIVNAANNRLKQGGGVCGAIFRAADAKKLQAACDAIGFCETGDAVLTPGFDLTAKAIIHTVGPVWQGGMRDEENLLRRCYWSSLELAADSGFESVAFPLISSGIYGYPKDQALQVAVSAIRSFLKTHDLMVSLVVFDRSAFELAGSLADDIQSYIDDHYVDLNRVVRSGQVRFGCPRRKCSPGSLEDIRIAEESLPLKLTQPAETFSELLLKWIDEKGLEDSTVYKRANIDRRLFSKIRSNKDYRVSKPTALALGIALGLERPEIIDLLARAGYALSPSSKSDIIIDYFIRQKKIRYF